MKQLGHKLKQGVPPRERQQLLSKVAGKTFDGSFGYPLRQLVPTLSKPSDGLLHWGDRSRPGSQLTQPLGDPLQVLPKTIVEQVRTGPVVSAMIGRCAGGGLKMALQGLRISINECCVDLRL